MRKHNVERHIEVTMNQSSPWLQFATVENIERLANTHSVLIQYATRVVMGEVNDSIILRSFLIQIQSEDPKGFPIEPSCI